MNLFLVSLFWIQAALATGPGQGNKVDIKQNAAKIYVESFAESFTTAFHKSINFYNENKDNPEIIVELVDDQKGKEFLLGLIVQNKNFKFPAIENKNGTYFMKFNEGVLKFDIIGAYEGFVYFNNKKFTFDFKKDLVEQINDFSSFLNQNSSKRTGLLNLFIPEANAIICGGFCIAALVGGTVTLGYGVYKYAMSVVGSDNNAQLYKDIAIGISKQKKECEESANKVEKYRGSHLGYERATPGSFSSFSLIKGALEKSRSVDSKALSKHIFEKLGGKDIDSCHALNQKILDSMGAVGRRNAQLQGMTIDTCQEHNQLISCLQDVYEIHLSHQGKRNIYERKYDSSSGVYDKSYEFSPSKGK